MTFGNTRRKLFVLAYQCKLRNSDFNLIGILESSDSIAFPKRTGPKYTLLRIDVVDDDASVRHAGDILAADAHSDEAIENAVVRPGEADVVEDDAGQRRSDILGRADALSAEDRQSRASRILRISVLMNLSRDPYATRTTDNVDLLRAAISDDGDDA